MQGVPASEQTKDCLNLHSWTDPYSPDSKSWSLEVSSQGAKYPSGELDEAIPNDAIQKARAEALGLSCLK